MPDEPRLHLEDWARAMTPDCMGAKMCIHICALSCMPPRSSAPGPWSTLWASWVATAASGRPVTLYLPNAHHRTPATYCNAGAAQQAARHGIACHLLTGPRLLHSKALIVDRSIVWIGSGNFTHAAALKNAESYIRIVSPLIAAALIRRLEALK